VVIQHQLRGYAGGAQGGGALHGAGGAAGGERGHDRGHAPGLGDGGQQAPGRQQLDDDSVPETKPDGGNRYFRSKARQDIVVSTSAENSTKLSLNNHCIKLAQQWAIEQTTGTLLDTHIHTHTFLSCPSKTMPV
jgi:hypothetical protein